MDIVWLGHASFYLKGKTTKVVMDPFEETLVGLKYPRVEADILTISHQHPDHNNASRVIGPDGGKPFTVAGPGEYEIKGVSIFGIPSFHDDKNGAERGKNTIYVVDIDGIKVCHLGDLGEKLNDKQISEIGDVDILLVPVGGFYTIDAKVAGEVIAQLEPKIVIPMHFMDKGMNEKDFGSLATVETFMSQVGAEAVLPVPKLTITKDKLPEQVQFVLLERKTV